MSEGKPCDQLERVIGEMMSLRISLLGTDGDVGRIGRIEKEITDLDSKSEKAEESMAHIRTEIAVIHTKMIVISAIGAAVGSAIVASIFKFLGG